MDKIEAGYMEDNRNKKDAASPLSDQRMVITDALETVIGRMLDAFTAEREKTEPYKEMFKAGKTWEGLLRQIDDVCTGAVLDASAVIGNKIGRSVNNETYLFLFAVPFLAHQLEKVITKTEGGACCVDKTFYFLADELQKRIG